MRRNKLERYTELSEECLDIVEDAKDHGVALNELELLDYYFKETLVFGSTEKNDIGFLADFFCEYLEEIFYLREVGYSNKDLLGFLKRVCFRGRVHGISKFKISGYDENGIFYLTLKNCKTKEEDTIEVTGKSSFTVVCLAIVTLVATDGLKEGNFKTFAEEYLFRVYKEISDCVVPKPYIYKGSFKSLRSYIIKSKSKGKIVEFKVG